MNHNYLAYDKRTRYLRNTEKRGGGKSQTIERNKARNTDAPSSKENRYVQEMIQKKMIPREIPEKEKK